MCCRSEWQERMYIYKWHEVDQTKHEIFCVHIVCNEIQVKVNLEITTFFFYLRFPYCHNFFWFGVVHNWNSELKCCKLFCFSCLIRKYFLLSFVNCLCCPFLFEWIYIRLQKNENLLYTYNGDQILRSLNMFLFCLFIFLWKNIRKMFWIFGISGVQICLFD